MTDTRSGVSNTLSHDTDVDDSRCAPPADPNSANSGAINPYPEENL